MFASKPIRTGLSSRRMFMSPKGKPLISFAMRNRNLLRTTFNGLSTVFLCKTRPCDEILVDAWWKTAWSSRMSLNSTQLSINATWQTFTAMSSPTSSSTSFVSVTREIVEVYLGCSSGKARDSTRSWCPVSSRGRSERSSSVWNIRCTDAESLLE